MMRKSTQDKYHHNDPRRKQPGGFKEGHHPVLNAVDEVQDDENCIFGGGQS